MILNNNYIKPCKSTLGGIKEFYLAPYTKWTKSQVSILDIELVSMPSTFFYKFDVNGTYNQDSDAENGAVFFNQSIEFAIQSPEYYTLFSALNFTKQYYRVIAKTNNGQYIIFGTYNGLEAKMTNASGSAKAEFNGFTVSFSGKEKDTAYLISNLEDANIIIVDDEMFNYDLNLDL